MGITLRWWDETHDILLYTYAGQWTWEEFHDAIYKAFILLDTVNYPVDFVADFTESITPLLDILPNFRRAAGITHPNTGVTALVGLKPAWNMVLRPIEEMFPWLTARFMIAASVQQAVDDLRTLRSSPDDA